jgi:transposase
VGYEEDVVAWAEQQAQLLRQGSFDQLDVERIAEEIEDVGKSEQRELANRLAVLLSHLIKWQRQPERRGASWELTIRNQRRGIARRLQETPSLRRRLSDAGWWAGVWDDATAQAAQETGLSDFAEACPWSPDRVLEQAWLPD